MANHLRTETKLAVLAALVEGCSVRSTERLTGVHRDTICRLLVRVGDGCEAILDDRMVNLSCKRLELDELWSFVGKKQRFVRPNDDAARVGDQWVYVAICAESKLIPTYVVGKREAVNTNLFVANLAARVCATACRCRPTACGSTSKRSSCRSGARVSTTRRS